MIVLLATAAKPVVLPDVLNEILNGQASLEGPLRTDPYRMTNAECVSCRRSFAWQPGADRRCPSCVRAFDDAMAAAAERNRLHSLVFGAALIVFGVLVTVFTYNSQLWIIGVGPIAAGSAGLLRYLVS